MPSHFQSRLSHVAQRLNETNGELVTINREGEAEIEITASPILQRAEEFVPGVAATRLEFQDWGIDVIDFDFGAGPVVPTLGDILQRANGERYRFIALGDTEPVYVYTTSTHNRYLIHAEQIEDA